MRPDGAPTSRCLTCSRHPASRHSGRSPDPVRRSRRCSRRRVAFRIACAPICRLASPTRFAPSARSSGLASTRSTSRSRWSIAFCFCSSRNRATSCRDPIRSTTRRTRSRGAVARPPPAINMPACGTRWQRSRGCCASGAESTISSCGRSTDASSREPPRDRSKPAAQRRAPTARTARRDEAAERALTALGTRPNRAGRIGIEYADLGVEQLGAVYERVLDLDHSGAHSAMRKQTGTFYTPQPLAEFVVRRTLAPLVSGATSEAILALRVVDPAMGSGAFLVAACRYLAGGVQARTRRRGPMLGSRFRRIGAGEHSTADRRALSLRRRCQSRRGAARALVALARDARARQAARLSRSSPSRRQQPHRRVARRSAPPQHAPAIGRICRCSISNRRPGGRDGPNDAAAPQPSLTRRDDTIDDVRAKEAAWAQLSR